MKAGDLVRETETGHIGIVLQVDKQYYGSRGNIKARPGTRGNPRGNHDLAYVVSSTKDDIQDRILLVWNTRDGGREYIRSGRLELISES